MSDTDLIVMARKPLSEKNIAHNVLRWGTGGINIDECRIGSDPIQVNVDYKSEKQSDMGWGTKKAITEIKEQGRFPANLIFDTEMGKILDEQSGTVKSVGGKYKENKDYDGSSYHMPNQYTGKNVGYGDTGGASRFFYNTDNELKQTTNRSEKMNYTIYNEDCLIQLKELEDNSIDSIVTDPPYQR